MIQALLLSVGLGFFAGACASRSSSTASIHSIEQVYQSTQAGKQRASMEYVVRGEKQYLAKNWNQAMLTLEQAVELDSRNAFAYLLLGMTKTKLQQPQQALNFISRALELLPSEQRHWRSEAYVAQGWAFEGLKNWSAAQDSYKKAVALNQSNTVARNALASVKEKKYE